MSSSKCEPRGFEQRLTSTTKTKESSPHPFQDDVAIGKAFDRRLMTRLLKYALPYRLRMGKLVFLIVVVTVLGIAGPLLIKLAIDGPLRASISGERTVDPSALLSLGWLTLLFAVISALLLRLRFLENYTMAQIGQSVMLDLRRELFQHLQRMPLSFYDSNPVGRLVTRITNDVE